MEVDLSSLISWIEINYKLLSISFAGLTLLIALVGFLHNVPKIRREVKRLREEQTEAASAHRKLAYLRKLSNDDQMALWSQSADLNDLEYHDRLEAGIPVILLANLKGGVGKTTIAANLAAALSDERKAGTGPGATHEGNRVLAIDLDYQGSLSSLFVGHNGLTGADVRDVQSRGAKLLDGEHDADWAQVAAQPLPAPLSNLRYLATTSKLADLENRLTLKWLIGDLQRDVRFHLFRILSHTRIQKDYDYIILDTAPRLTLAFINGLCAATHLVIPTQLDDLSAQSAGNFLWQYKGLRKRLCPQLELLGVIGSMTHYSEPGKYSESEGGAIATLNQRIRKEYGPGDFFLENCNIRRDKVIRDAAGAKLAYFSDDESTIFKRLATEVIERTRR